MHAFQRPFRALVLALALALTSAAGLVPSANAASAEGAAKFIRELGHQAIDDLGDESVPTDTRVERFQQMVNEAFAMPAISRFVLGRYAHDASDSEMTAFREVFLEAVAQRFLPLFNEYSEDDFHVEGAKQDPRSDSLYLVNSRVRSPQSDQFAKAGWRVRHKDGAYEIVDVIAEGVSMAITLRSEYSSVIQQNGGQVSALINKLAEKVEQGKVRGSGLIGTDSET